MKPLGDLPCRIFLVKGGRQRKASAEKRRAAQRAKLYPNPGKNVIFDDLKQRKAELEKSIENRINRLQKAMKEYTDATAC